MLTERSSHHGPSKHTLLVLFIWEFDNAESKSVASFDSVLAAGAHLNQAGACPQAHSGKRSQRNSAVTTTLPASPRRLLLLGFWERCLGQEWLSPGSWSASLGPTRLLTAPAAARSVLVPTPFRSALISATVKSVAAPMRSPTVARSGRESSPSPPEGGGLHQRAESGRRFLGPRDGSHSGPSDEAKACQCADNGAPLFSRTVPLPTLALRTAPTP